ncbi:ferritin-like domain-containing protein [Clostridium sporogenes]|uniref:ferritin-like domain-containing protein n=1 Tax=Clostridium sporogenes TaxID=1509 RepID=UPI001969F7D9|nr:ferritin-like domain-containing protein [Clostridium sporogenes]MCW6061516.1 ferritin-like domain-containing protein [Clostridium sporogenes]MCW6067770.1 ferritin-like domain-containing protein [Clostridium sporogenes]MDS1009190.1 ferritin-like domain-containing protein [Clostridium sporogenes]
MPRGEIPMMNNIQFQEALEEIKRAVQHERKDELFNEYLINIAPTREEEKIIESIRDDEYRHSKLLRRIYMDFTGMEVPIDEEETIANPENYLDGIKKALFRKLRTIEKYRAWNRGPYKDMVSNIITDEIKHSSKYNYLFALNSNMKVMDMNRSPVQDTSKFTPDDWVRYITPLVNRALAEAKAGINPEHLYQEFILAGVLVGLGKTPQEAIDQVEEWENTGESQLLAKSKMARGFY